ncbi:hypothetical protein F4804DRAFT_333486 [Jackrogersella minutella]|nr:hypothetical protein F4804DRAFT_333486 [Jackrogersella minutella]
MLGKSVVPFVIASIFLGRSSAGAVLASATASVIAQHAVKQPVSIETPPPVLALEARDRAGGLCGYYNGDAASPYICSSGYSCVQDRDNAAVGCVSTNTKKSLLGVVYTTCLNYNVYTKYSVGPRTGCCVDPDLPACVRNTYTGTEAEGYTIIECAPTYNAPGVLLAWEASTSGASGTTLIIGIPTATSNATTTPASSSTPSSSPNPPSGLSTSDKITLGTALGLGIPATIAGIIGTWYAYRSWKASKEEEEGDMVGLISRSHTDEVDHNISKPEHEVL